MNTEELLTLARAGNMEARFLLLFFLFTLQKDDKLFNEVTEAIGYDDTIRGTNPNDAATDDDSSSDAV